MFCYHCGCQLSEHEFCTACGADVSLYKKIICVSNLFYNDGLEKAQVRDLSGAVNSLRQSVKFNKNNIDARNLLGLVYFEMGEVVAALSEWVISKNLRSDKNIADVYIKMIQSNTSRLDSINQTIKKYNQALAYCLQDSKDLAVIQLKKVLSLNPRFIRAHQLLALLYLDSEQWEKAKRELKKCMDIDRNNTITLRYLKEIESILVSEETAKPERRSRNDDYVRYQSDNELIIQPISMNDSKRSGVSSLLNIALGVIIGLASMYFLVVPAKVANERNQAQKEITEFANEMDAKTILITQLESKVESLEKENTELYQDLEGYMGTDGTLNIMESMLLAASVYMETKDAMLTAEHLEDISANTDLEQTSEAFQSLYTELALAIGTEVAVGYYEAGDAALASGDYPEAVANLEKAVFYDPTHDWALYKLGHAYRENGDKELAIETYQKVMEMLPGTKRYIEAENHIKALSES